jgi:hypothetical protein
MWGMNNRAVDGRSLQGLSHAIDINKYCLMVAALLKITLSGVFCENVQASGAQRNIKLDFV